MKGKYMNLYMGGIASTKTLRSFVQCFIQSRPWFMNWNVHSSSSSVAIHFGQNQIMKTLYRRLVGRKRFSRWKVGICSQGQSTYHQTKPLSLKSQSASIIEISILSKSPKRWNNVLMKFKTFKLTLYSLLISRLATRWKSIWKRSLNNSRAHLHKSSSKVWPTTTVQV